jgi:DHA1 family tetracycline resistance protein-like MFS transporter
MPYRWRRANPLGSLHLLRTNRVLLRLAGVAFLYHLAHAVLPSVAVLYASYRYGWGEQALGLTLAAVGVASGLVQGFMIQPAIRLFGERTTLLAGLIFGAAGFAIYGLAETGAWFLAGIPVMALWGLTGASTMGIMSRQVGGSEQGQLQGANSSLMALASLFGPALFTLSFAWSITPGQAWHVPGAPFLLAALLMVAALALAWHVTRPGREPARKSA